MVVAFDPALVRAEALTVRGVIGGDARAFQQAERETEGATSRREKNDYAQYLRAFVLTQLGRADAAEQALALTEPNRRHVYARFFEKKSEDVVPYLRVDVEQACRARQDLPADVCQVARGDVPRPTDYPVFEQVSSIPHASDRIATWNRALAGEGPEALARRVGIEPGMDVADIGAGEGYFTLPFARVVGLGGSVTANDIEPAFLDFIQFGATYHHLENVRTVLGTPDDARLPPASMDVVFVCEVFKAVFTNDQARDPAYVAAHVQPFVRSLHDALRPGGRLVVIEHDVPPSFGKDISEANIRAAAEGVGFRFVALRDDFKPRQFLLVMARGEE